MRLKPIAIAAAIAAALSATAMLPGTAGARLAGGCSGYNCDYQDPIAEGCNQDAYTVGASTIDDAQGNQLGYVELRWSPSCQTNWARVTSTSGAIYDPRVMRVEIVRSSDGAYEYLDTDGNQGNGNNQGGVDSTGNTTYQGTTVLYTDMLYSPISPASAIGTIDGHNGFFSQNG